MQFFVQSFQEPFGSWTSAPRIVDVHTKKCVCVCVCVCFPEAPMMERNFLTPGKPGAQVRNVCRNSKLTADRGFPI